MATFIEIIKSEDFTEIMKIFESNKPAHMASSGYTSDIAKEEYFTETHSVMRDDAEHRPDKTVYKPVLNSRGEPTINQETGKPEIAASKSKVTRVPIPFPEIIVNRRIGFMLGYPIKYDVTYDSENQNEKSLVDFFNEIEENAKMLYKNKEIARRVMSEMACAELWYLTEIKEPEFWTGVSNRLKIRKQEFELKVKILSPWLGDNLYPLFDAYGDMIAFGRGYKLKEDEKEVEHFDIYTSEFTYKYVKRDAWALDSQAVNGGKIPNSVGKIPVVYHTQEKPEWANVQKMIERLEKLLSNHGDMNDYFGEPILAIFGQLISAINKGDSGKILQLSENAKASFLALDSPPESIKMEIENLEKFIFSLSQTPNIAFSEMKSLGDLSGVALALMFMDAHLAVMAKEETFGIGLQRRANLIKATIGKVLDVNLSESAQKVKMKPVITPYMPKNIKELIDMLAMSVDSGFLSAQTATQKLEDDGFINDAEVETAQINSELDAKSKRDNIIGLNVQ